MRVIKDPVSFIWRLDYKNTPPLEAGTKPVGFPPWSCGPLLHRGGEAVALPFGQPRGSNPLVDIT